MLLSNVSISAACWAPRNVSHVTQLYGQEPGSRDQHRRAHELWQQPAAQAPAAAAHAQPQQQDDGGDGWPPLPRQFTLAWGHVAGALQLPHDAPDKYLQLQNVTLAQLPQGPGAAGAVALALPAGSSEPTPPSVWTLLLWPISRCARPATVSSACCGCWLHACACILSARQSACTAAAAAANADAAAAACPCMPLPLAVRSLVAAPLFVSDAQLLLPAPEFDFLAAAASAASSFAVQLQGACVQTRCLAAP